jgi:hypothetical protein
MSRGATPRSAIGVGLSTLVTIMVVVLLTTFSVLTLVSARADLRLSNRAVAAMEGFYAADGEAQRWLADVDALIRETIRGADGQPQTVLSEAGYQVSTDEEGRVRLVEVFTVDDRRELNVEIALDTTGEIDILRWQTAPRQGSGQ